MVTRDSASGTASKPPREVDYEDVDDVIGLAAEMAQAQDRLITVAELEDVAQQLDIPKQFVTPAVFELKARRRQARRRKREARRRSQGLWVVVVAAVLCVPVYGMVVHGGLKRHAAEAAKAKSQWRNVMERQAAVRKRYETAPPSPERDAELDGAENRVRIERERYDRTVTEYNIAAAGPVGSLLARLGDLPADLPLSEGLP